MEQIKRCHKHPYIEVEESCTRCGRHICNDCRIREEKEPFCSAWCQRLYTLEEMLDTGEEPGTRLSIPDQFKRLIPLADSLIAFIICLLALYSYINISAKNLDTLLTEAERKGADQKTVNALKKSIEIPPAQAPEYVVQVQVEEIIKDRSEKPELRKKTYRAVRRPAPAGSINRVRGAGKRLAITFDGGSNDASASEILNILQKRDIQTTLFLTARFIKLYPDIVRRMTAEGHEIGNHTYSHPHLTTFSENRRHETSPGVDYAYIKRELEETARLFTKVTGTEMAPLWRAPYGEMNREILKWAAEIGYQHIAWTVDYKAKQTMDSLDWVADKDSTYYLTAEEIKNRLLAFADEKGRARGGIILMHLGTERSDDILHEKLEDIIDGFIARGYEIVPVSALIKTKKAG